ncbi:putative RPL14B-ribosomal protein, partial [Fistulina hepatica ATCC 64428]
STFTRFVQVGRVVLLKDGPDSGKIAVIAEIIDHNRAIVDGPFEGSTVARQPYAYKHLALTPILVKSVPNGARTGTIRKIVEKEATLKKWQASAWAKKLEIVKTRRNMNDFARFNVMLEKKRRRDVVRRALSKAKN